MSQKIYSECSRFNPNRFTLGGVISKRVNTVRPRSKMSFEPNNYKKLMKLIRRWDSERELFFITTASTTC